MAANDPAIACANGAITFDELLRSSIGTDASGYPTLRLYESADTGDDYIACTNNSIPTENIIRELFTLDGAGKIAIRVSITP